MAKFEIVAKVPFLPIKTTDFNLTEIAYAEKATFKQDYSIMARYTFSF